MSKPHTVARNYVNTCQKHRENFTFYCPECDTLLCNECVEVHSIKDNTKGHQLKTRKNAIQSSPIHFESLENKAEQLKKKFKEQSEGFQIQEKENILEAPMDKFISLSRKIGEVFEEIEILAATEMFSKMERRSGDHQFAPANKTFYQLEAFDKSLNYRINPEEKELGELYSKSNRVSGRLEELEKEAVKSEGILKSVTRTQPIGFKRSLFINRMKEQIEHLNEIGIY